MTLFPWRRLVAFAVLPMISMLSPILVIPSITATLGAAGWASIAIGQSVGMLGALVINFGWGVVGPSVVAAAGSHERRIVYRRSIEMRLLVAIVVLPACFGAASLIDSGNSLGAGLMALAMGTVGLSPTWYYIGLGQASRIAIYDTIPRVMAALATIPLLGLVPSVGTFPVLLLLATLIPSMLAWISISGVQLAWARDRMYIMKHFRDQAGLVISGLISSGYTTMAVAIVAVVDYSSVATYAGADRVRGLGKQGIAAVGNGLQGWVSETRSARETWQRMSRSLLALTLVGLAGATVLAVGLPVLDGPLFSGEIEVSRDAAIWAGLSLFFTAVTTSFSFHILAPLGFTGTITVATTLGALAGVPALVFLTRADGASGAMLATALAEGIVFLVEGIAVFRLYTRNRRKYRSMNTGAVA